MPALVHQKCLNHGQREAVARCPACAFHFCRECIAEHEGRLLCASCLAKGAAGKAGPDGSRAALLRHARAMLGASAGFALAWVLFLALGKFLIGIPSTFHDGSWIERLGEPRRDADGR